MEQYGVDIYPEDYERGILYAPMGLQSTGPKKFGIRWIGSQNRKSGGKTNRQAGGFYTRRF